jgi:hypothetical protein
MQQLGKSWQIDIAQARRCPDILLISDSDEAELTEKRTGGHVPANAVSTTVRYRGEPAE